ncbi:class I SAM-dependent methyltransferase [Thermocrispum municipale]|jgi:SAM-dependent methyltransferase|uniref:class I SAM-dependent methyltransferase n=1 Tax=Thermocrispum municipale TaxID=37926 RepID=UPI00041D053B|nr:class I SAM-dependent methyltransferase [Thermocrispum municipale]
MTDTVTFEEIKAKQQKIWSSGDYGKIAWITVPVAETLAEVVDLRPGSRVLDVATGTGHVALAAARRFCDVSGIDYVPALVDSAHRRAAAEDLDIDFREADAEDLPFDDATFDYTLSAIGVMFTADHQRAANELVRVTRPGGRVGIASWTATGFVGQLLKTVGKHAAPPPGSLPPVRWGDEATVREMLGEHVSDTAFSKTRVTQRFLSPEHFADFFLTHYGPTHMAAARLDDDGRAAFRADMIALAAESNKATDGTLVSDWEYLITIATKA